jgi:hypothetical protein
MPPSPWEPPPVIRELEQRLATVEPLYRRVWFALYIAARENEALESEAAVCVLLDLAAELAVASGVLWMPRPNICATFRGVGDALEHRRASEDARPLVRELAAVLRTRTGQPPDTADGGGQPMASSAHPSQWPGLLLKGPVSRVRCNSLSPC